MLPLNVSYVVRFIQFCIVFELKIALRNMSSYNFPLFKFITNSYNWISYIKYERVYNNEYTYYILVSKTSYMYPGRIAD
jgi:hypothetical protein